MYRILSICVLFAIAISAYAIHEDSKERMIINSDTSHYHSKSGMNIFEGNVKIDQGTTHITADRVVTINNKAHQVKEAIAYGVGQPAHYWTLTRQNNSELHAYANIIKYYPAESNVVLEKNAVVLHDRHTFQGSLVLYNMLNTTITVPEQKNAKSVLIYNPEELS